MRITPVRGPETTLPRCLALVVASAVAMAAFFTVAAILLAGRVVGHHGYKWQTTSWLAFTVIFTVAFPTLFVAKFAKSRTHTAFSYLVSLPIIIALLVVCLRIFPPDLSLAADFLFLYNLLSVLLMMVLTHYVMFLEIKRCSQER
jgi:hypothetical protein